MTNEEVQNQLRQAEAAEALGNYDESERLSQQILTMLSDAGVVQDQGTERTVLQAGAIRMLGVVRYRRGDCQQALEHLQAALQISSQINDQAGIASALGNIGNVQFELSDYAKALEYHDKALSINEELGIKERVAVNLGNIGLVYQYLSDYPKALEYYGKALSITEESGNVSAGAIWLGNIGAVYWNLSDYPKALEYYSRALGIAEELGNRRAVAVWLGNLGIVHQNLADYPKALDYYGKALNITEELGNKKGSAIWLGNIGVVHHQLSDNAKALEYYTKALSRAEEVGDKSGTATWLSNIGTVYFELSDGLKALEYFDKALRIDEEVGNKKAVAVWLGNIGNVYKVLGNFPKALENYQRALAMQEELGNRSESARTKAALGELYSLGTNPSRDEARAETYLRDSIALSQELGTKTFKAHKPLAELYERQERWQEANQEWKIYHALKDEVQSEEAKKSAALMEQRKQVAEREKEIAIAKASADAQMSATTTLLYKVLPQSVAIRIINGEEEIADYFPTVSILFADIAGFTPISADMPAIVVVRFLNYVFGEFDRIIKKHGCEKIKTIGDGYMAVCGAPIECADHAERLAAAALEMQETITLPESIREYMPSGIKLGIRVGLHTGSIVAGVIGEERFVYDIYSDAVNTAARMESHGEENKIHVSNDFFRHLQNRFAMTKNTTHGFVFEKRGEMEIKGKGMMRTYFLEKAA